MRQPSQDSLVGPNNNCAQGMAAPDNQNGENNNKEIKVQSGLRMKSSANAGVSVRSNGKNNSQRLAGVQSNRSSARNRAGARDPKSGAGAGFQEDKSAVRSGFLCCGGATQQDSSSAAESGEGQSACTIF